MTGPYDDNSRIYRGELYLTDEHTVCSKYYQTVALIQTNIHLHHSTMWCRFSLST